MPIMSTFKEVGEARYMTTAMNGDVAVEVVASQELVEVTST